MPNGYGGPYESQLHEDLANCKERVDVEVELRMAAYKEIKRLKRELTIAISKQDKS